MTGTISRSSRACTRKLINDAFRRKGLLSKRFHNVRFVRSTSFDRSQRSGPPGRDSELLPQSPNIFRRRWVILAVVVSGGDRSCCVLPHARVQDWSGSPPSLCRLPLALAPFYCPY